MATVRADLGAFEESFSNVLTRRGDGVGVEPPPLLFGAAAASDCSYSRFLKPHAGILKPELLQ